MMIFTNEILDGIKITPLMDTLRLENISDASYFGEQYSDFISNSRMGLINPAQGGTPEAYFQGLSKNAKFTTSLAFGTAVHELSLQPEGFFLCEDVAAPTAKVGLMADWLWKCSKNGELPDDNEIREAAVKVDYYKGIPSAQQLKKVKEAIKPYFKERYKFEQDSTDERTPIYFDDKNRDRLREVIKSLNENKDIQALLHPEDLVGGFLPSENERTILLDVLAEVPGSEPVTLRLKAKLDNFTIDQVSKTITVNDVKTTGKLLTEFDSAVKTYHYYRELAFYAWLLSLCAKKFYNIDNPTIKGNFLVVETIPAYWSSVVAMKPKWFVAGIKEFQTLLKMIAYYTVNGYEQDCSTEKSAL